MEVLLLTTLFSVVFALLFLTLFLRERQVRRFGGVERDALMPLDDGDSLPAAKANARPAAPSDRHLPHGGQAPAQNTDKCDSLQAHTRLS